MTENSTLITVPIISTSKSFIEANTIECSMSEIRKDHIIPVFAKDNEPTISHIDFIESAQYAISRVFNGEEILKPNIRLSHPVKGRVPDAKYKAANELTDAEKTVYYERMMFCIEIPSIYDNVSNNHLSLTVGGVKSYTLDNLNNRKGVDENFKVFIGFKNRVCTNLCVSTDGLLADLKVKNVGQLQAAIIQLFQNFNSVYQLSILKKLCQYELNENQFAQIVGKCRLYQFLPKQDKDSIPPLLITDTQINTIAKDFYWDDNFQSDSNNSITLWRFYNLFTGANKSSYVDTFLERAANATNFANHIQNVLEGNLKSWYLP
jgi:hypothetical protein